MFNSYMLYMCAKAATTKSPFLHTFSAYPSHVNKSMHLKHNNIQELVGLAGFEPVTFTRNHTKAWPQRVSLALTAPETRHPTRAVRKPVQIFWSPSSYLARLQPHKPKQRNRKYMHYVTKLNTRATKPSLTFMAQSLNCLLPTHGFPSGATFLNINNFLRLTNPSVSSTNAPFMLPKTKLYILGTPSIEATTLTKNHIHIVKHEPSTLIYIKTTKNAFYYLCSKKSPYGHKIPRSSRHKTAG